MINRYLWPLCSPVWSPLYLDQQWHRWPKSRVVCPLPRVPYSHHDQWRCNGQQKPAALHRALQVDAVLSPGPRWISTRHNRDYSFPGEAPQKMDFFHVLWLTLQNCPFPIFFISSPEPKAQMNFFDWDLFIVVVIVF